MIIFLPTHNGGRYIRSAIESILAQTDPDWRLIVLENGSTDDTVDAVRGYRDDRIVLRSVPTSLGIVANWQRGHAYLRDEISDDPLVTFIGDDDYFYPGFVASIRELARSDPRATLFQTGFDLVDGDGALIRPCRPIPEVESWQDLAAALCWGMRDSFGTGYAWRARDYVSVGGIPDLPMLLSSDHLLFIRLARLGHKRADPRAHCAYRFHRGSTSGGLSRAKINASLEALDGLVAALQAMEDFPTSQRGRDALAAMLGRELAAANLRAAGRALTADNKVRRARLNAVFASVSRGLPIEVWADPEAGAFNQLVRPLRNLMRSAAIWRAVRRT